MVKVMKIMVTSFKRSCVLTAAHIAPDPAAGYHQPTPLLEIPGYSQATLGQSLLGSLLLSLGFWFAQCFVCALQESVSPVLCKFCNRIPLASKVKFPGGSQSLCQIPRLRNLLCILELSLQCESLFGMICSAVCGLTAQGFYSGVNGDLLEEGLCHMLCKFCLHLEV